MLLTETSIFPKHISISLVKEQSVMFVFIWEMEKSIEETVPPMKALFQAGRIGTGPSGTGR